MSHRNVVRVLRPVRQDTSTIRRFRILSLRHTQWIVWPLAAGLVYLMVGLPHLRIFYTYHETAAGPHYTHCTYWAPWGLHERRPADGLCPLIGFYHR
ncbi:MAG TPA: hypothetical protein PLW75_02285 [Hyphomicrobium sp.]|nr:hypothetical protein [Hyphomicrobium sp.]